MLCSVQEVVLPGSVFQHGAILLFKAADAGGGIQAEDAGIVAVLVGKGVILVCVAIAHLRGGVILAAHSESGGFVNEPGVEHEHQRHNQNDGDRAERPAEIALLLFLGFLLQGKGLLVSTCLAGGLAVFLFS